LQGSGDAENSGRAFKDTQMYRSRNVEFTVD